MPTRRVAQGRGTSRPGTRRIRQNLRERGTLEPARAKTGYASGLTDEVAARLRELIAAEPGSTRQTLRDRLGVGCDVRTVGRWLRKLGLLLKKSPHAAEQERAHVKERREAWHASLAGVPADKLVFVDESGARTNMTRFLTAGGRSGREWSMPRRTGTGRHEPCWRRSG